MSPRTRLLQTSKYFKLRDDCKNNIDNCKLEPIYYEIGVIFYIKNSIPYSIMKTIVI